MAPDTHPAIPSGVPEMSAAEPGDFVATADNTAVSSVGHELPIAVQETPPVEPALELHLRRLQRALRDSNCQLTSPIWTGPRTLSRTMRREDKGLFDNDTEFFLPDKGPYGRSIFTLWDQPSRERYQGEDASGFSENHRTRRS